jgi:hypothetical protein
MGPSAHAELCIETTHTETNGDWEHEVIVTETTTTCYFGNSPNYGSGGGGDNTQDGGGGGDGDLGNPLETLDD